MTLSSVTIGILIGLVDRACERCYIAKQVKPNMITLSTVTETIDGR